MLAINRSPIGARLEGNPLRRWGLSLAAAGLVLAASAAPVLANPQGGVVVAGQGAISTPNVNTTLINQQSNNLVVNWNSFNVANNQSVQFQQPSVSAAALNRILDQNPSQILGSIIANGQV